PAIRREYIFNEEDIHQSQGDEIPPLARGMTLDRLLRDLFASVATALDEYRRQATQSYDDTVGPEPIADPSQEPKVRSGIAKSLDLEERLQEASRSVSEVSVPDSENADLLIRRIKDVEGINRLARAELQMRAVVLRWYKSIAARLKDYPKLIK